MLAPCYGWPHFTDEKIKSLVSCPRCLRWQLMEAGFKLCHSYTKAALVATVLSLWKSLHVCSFPDRPFSPPHRKLPEEQVHTLDLSRHFAHGRCPTAVCAPQAGFQKEEEGVESSIKKKSQFSTLEHSPALWLQPKARPSSALGNKYLYGDNYSIWEENPIKQEPCRAANAGTELKAAQNWRRQLRQAPVCSQ